MDIARAGIGVFNAAMPRRRKLHPELQTAVEEAREALIAKIRRVDPDLVLELTLTRRPRGIPDDTAFPPDFRDKFRDDEDPFRDIFFDGPPPDARRGPRVRPG